MKPIFVTIYFAIMTNVVMAYQLHTAAILIEHPWARAVPATSPTTAVYFSLTNEGQHPERLLSASTPNAKRTEIHDHIHDRGVMRMRHLKAGVMLAPKQKIVFAPGGLHLMLFGIKGPYRPGDRFPMTLHFEQAKDKTVEVEVMSGGNH